ncbi:hypothetical protein [Aquiflexum gelatinilyticum]|uniref:hypothetical protein n=1 Tax=Aquiflexum gelatinilyticum TaxID=2961943 RepID=UPI00216A0CCF|nr:hypothetical protein [Aquiflexum gelatinilyticum]MCS4434200.1 hypothetical protein [Aquiflexum gelatinilyticum]
MVKKSQANMLVLDKARFKFSSGLYSKVVAILCLFLHNVASYETFAQIPSNPPSVERDPDFHIPGLGFQVFEGDKGTLSISFYSVVRYLNQNGIDSTYTDFFERDFSVKRRNDIQFQKVMIYFKGWVYTPKFRYLFYTWTANPNLGLPAHVVVGGNFQYQFHKMIDIGLGIGGLPSTRGMLGQWPFWLRNDARPMAEEFFRASFTTGIWVQGELVQNRLFYKTMLGNNLSQLGVNGNQLDNGFDTFSGTLWWTTGAYGRLGPFGDFENTQAFSTVFGASYTHSTETEQTQPGSDKPENTQLRLSDGTIIFNRNAFGEGLGVDEAKYEMVAINTGAKYKGFSLDLEYYLRWLSNFKSKNPLPVESLFDHGFTTRASGMIKPKLLQAYLHGSKIFGQYGDPWEIGFGLNYFPSQTRVIRLNPELIRVEKSPVGYLAFPTNVGSSGLVFMANLEFFF